MGSFKMFKMFGCAVLKIYKMSRFLKGRAGGRSPTTIYIVVVEYF